MFENIHFQKTVFEIDSPPVSVISPDALPMFGHLELPDDSIFYRNSSFCLEGVSRSCQNRPLTEFAHKNFFFIQSFSIMDSAANYFTRRYNFNSFLISYTFEGEGFLEYEGNTYHLKEGDGFFIDCTKPHYYRTEGTHWKHGDLHFSGSHSEYIHQCYMQENKPIFFQPLQGEFLPQLEQLIELHESITPFRELQISNQMQNLLVMLLCKTEAYEKTLRQIPEHLEYLVSYLENNYARPLTLDFLADFSNISKYHLCRLFKKYLGFTPNEYIIQLRVENAGKLLKSTTLPANKIGNMVGIQDENYFYRMFKKRTGLSPLEFRDSN